jgi:RNA polymerase sigma-70 factor (ECF subfamily)
MKYLRLVHSAPSSPRPEDACVQAFDRELDYVFETLQRLGANKGEIEDLAQEVFVVLHRHWATLDLTRSLRPYLFGVAFRIVCAHRRRRSRETPYASLDTEDQAATPERSLQTKESIELLLAALSRVPLARRAVVVMHDLDDVPVADIAQTLSLTRFGTYSRLRKARKELAAAVRRLLGERGRR